jgi:hypothetical protein
VRLEADEALWFVLNGHRPEGGKRRRWPVIIVHHDHHVLVDNADDDEALMGWTDYGRRRVYIDGSRTRRSMCESVLHESPHCVLHDSLPSCVTRLRCSVDIEEALIRDVSPVLLRNYAIQFPPFPPQALAVIKAARIHRRRAA